MPDMTPDAGGAQEHIVSSSLTARMTDRDRWQRAFYDLAIWLLVGLLFTTALRMYSPGYPIVVGSPSIPMGFYWVDRTVTHLQPGDYASFDFKPTQAWLQGRYGGQDPVHTKQVLGVAGDVVHADSALRLTVCHPAREERAEQCLSAGQVLAKDSAGRDMHSWLPAGQSYTLRPGELWVYGSHPKSLDSRYHGPVPESAMHGKATPLWLF